MIFLDIPRAIDNSEQLASVGSGHGCKYFPKSLNNSFAKYPSPVYILSPRPLATICISATSKYWTKKPSLLSSAFSDDSCVVTVTLLGHWGYWIVGNWFIEPVLVWGSLFYTMPNKRMATQTRMTICLPSEENLLHKFIQTSYIKHFCKFLSFLLYKCYLFF